MNIERVIKKFSENNTGVDTCVAKEVFIFANVEHAVQIRTNVDP